MDIYYVVFECRNTGKATRTGLELTDLAAFDYIGLRPEACVCEHCHESHVWSHKDAWVERHQGSRVRIRSVGPPEPAR